MFTRNTEKLESFVGANSAFKGNIETKGTLRIDGKLEGNIQADWVILGEKSFVKGDITARGIIVGGSVDGNLRAKEIIEIKSKGRVTGDTVTTKLTISEGGIFDGRSTMAKDESKVLEFQSKI
ncbi:MAG: polymer-forming cytoskeletal protein [Thermodesulfovibrionales bacterium]|nr:polymer-forming cytoskeletal protein [Thermodesulfovibrionales bacterium]